MSKDNKNVRLRFAPSPTGYLHIGGLRTALFSYLIAKNLGGELILRIEDTDQSRRVEGAVEKLIEILDWSGIHFDEEPYVQSERKEIYQKYIKDLVDKGAAYPCFCSAERLSEMREKQQANKEAPRYDGHCCSISPAKAEERMKKEPHVIRQKMPKSGEVKVYDELRGEIVFKVEDLDDHVLMKTDGMPTYQFANIVDDHLMSITHVTRGEEWIPSFPKNVLLYEAFGWEAPKFIHLPLILNKEGGKLSKRQNDVAVEDYRDKGYLPEALNNFCALLGWHPKGDEEIFSLAELTKIFNYKDIGTSPAVFDVDKLNYFNGYYIRQKSLDELHELCLPYLETGNKDSEFVKKVVGAEQERIKTLSEIKELTRFFFVEKPEYDPELLRWKQLSLQEVKANLEDLSKFLETLDKWDDKSLEEIVIKYLKDNDHKVGDYLWPLRVALSGQKASPGPFEIASILGKEETLVRIQQAIKS